MERLGRPDFVSPPQDWMCEPVMIARTGLSVREHQDRTVANFLRLRELAPGVPFTPVLQGWRLPDYENGLALYGQAGVDLPAAPVGSQIQWHILNDLGTDTALMPSGWDAGPRQSR
jgi:hypothetical protein